MMCDYGKRPILLKVQTNAEYYWRYFVNIYYDIKVLR